MFLYNGNKKVLQFDLEEGYIEVLDKDFLPFGLKSISTTDYKDYKKTFHDNNILKDWLCGRILDVSRTNAKAILNSATLPQSQRTSEKLKIVYACHGLSMNDNFWLKGEYEDICFKDINLRHNRTSEAEEKSFETAINGKIISVKDNELIPDLSTTGTFPKFWYRSDDEIYLCKTSKTKDFVNVKVELEAVDFLHSMGFKIADYDCAIFDTVDGVKFFSASKLINSDEISLVTALEIKDFIERKNENFLNFIDKKIMGLQYNTKTFMSDSKYDFANMVIADYLIGNTDRHLENWGFLVDNDTNKIISLSPLYDFNMALICDKTHSDIDNLIYAPTGLTYKESVEKYIPYISPKLDYPKFDLLDNDVRKMVEKRFEFVKQLAKENHIHFGRPEEKEQSYYFEGQIKKFSKENIENQI